jgi:hypothetical protein
MKESFSCKFRRTASLTPIALLVFALFASATAGSTACMHASSDTGIIAFEKHSIVLDVNDSQWFELKINVTDVTNLKAIVFSVEWDPTYLEVPTYTPGDLLPAMPPSATGWMITWDHVAGKMKEAANSFLAGHGPVNVSSPDWGWVMTLNFSYVGPDPPITTSINITKNLGEFMDTKWRDSSDVYHDFDYLGVDPIVHMISTEIIPEFPLATVMMGLFIVATLLAVVFKKKSGSRQHCIR